jgi:H+/Na+-translocating ferredoxin:NAD+ oxidoreductase subunit D
MAEEAIANAPEDKPQLDAPAPAPVVHVAPGPHISLQAFSTRRMMTDVLIALVPIVGVSLYVFRWYAVVQLGICIAGCIVAEAIFTAMRGRRPTLGDCSAIVTGAILALSLPATAPWYVGVIGSFAAIGLGKVIFGGLGGNIFNPAMVGRAFVMIAFTGAMAAPGYMDVSSSVQAVTEATPMTVMKDGGSMSLLPLLLGNANGSLGETSALACLIGGLFLCVRRTAAWQLPAGALLSVAVLGGVTELLSPSNMTVLHHLMGGALLLGAFFIITDPVSSPLTPWGRFIGGLVFGALVMLMRFLSAYPEGVMFAVLLMNALVPLINRWTIPRPVGGPVPAKK